MVNPLMLFGLLGLAIPIVIHLIQRQRLRPRMLATMQFLDADDVANSFSPMPRDVLQLLLRLLLLLLFVLLMARVALSSDVSGPRVMVVLLDGSLSMQRQTTSERTLFDVQKAEILKLVDSMGPEDRMSFRLIGDEVLLETEFLQEPDTLRQLITELEVTDDGGQAMLPAIQSALESLQSRREVNSAVLVYSDHQRTAYSAYLNATDGSTPADTTTSIRRLLSNKRVKLVMVTDPELKVGANLAVADAWFAPPRTHLGSSAKLTASVRNFSDEEQTVDVTFVEGRKADEPRALTLQPGETAAIDLVHRFNSPADVPCTLSLQDDLLLADNHHYAPMRVLERQQILIVTPPSTSAAVGDTVGHRGVDLLHYAVNPGDALGLDAGTNVNVKRVTTNNLERLALPIYSTIVLYGVVDLPEQAAKDVRSYVENGGGLYIVPTSEVSPVRFNEGLGALLNGFLLGTMQRPSDVMAIRDGELGIEHDVLLPLLRAEWGDISDVTFSAYFGVLAAGSSRCALRASNGDCLAAMIAVGKGRVFIQQFTLALADNSLARSVVFVPMVQEVVRRLGRNGGETAADAIQVGDHYRMNLPEYRRLGEGLQIALDSASPTTLDYETDEHALVRLPSMYRAGHYAVRHAKTRTGRVRWLGVNPQRDESLLPVMAAEQWQAVFAEMPVAHLSYDEVDDSFARKREAKSAVFIVAFMLFLVEAASGAWQARRRKEAVV